MTVLDHLATGWKSWIILFTLTFVAAAPGVFNLPALDRDEARFAQSSKQYLETGDYVVLRYQDEFRNKKPAGIHWLQAGSTAVLGDEDRLEIWTYRVPSWIGVALASVATFWAGLAFLSRRAAFVGALMFGATLLVTSEGHISKTDGVLIFLTAWGIGVLGRLYMTNNQSKGLALLFWGIMGASFLVKGPVTPMVAAYAGFGAWIWAKAAEGKGGDWWRPLIWWGGPAIFVAMVLPWFIWIQIATGGAYIEGAVGKDLKDKFAGASEGHAGWPLYHLSHIPAWYFPATLIFVPGIVAAWQALRGQSDSARRRGTDALLIIVALGALTAFATWLLPGELGNGTPSAYPALILIGMWFLATRREWRTRWPNSNEPVSDEMRALRMLVAWAALTAIFFELMPTKLSHYILPAYPALALLGGWAVDRMLDGRDMPVSRWVSTGLFVFGGLVLMLVSSPLAVDLVQAEAAGDFKTVDSNSVLAQWNGQSGFPIWLWIAGGVAIALSAFAFTTRSVAASLLFGIAASVLLGWHARIYVLPGQLWVQATEVGRSALTELCGVPGEPCDDESLSAPLRILAVGYSEPSYVMSLGTQNLHPPETPIGLPDDAEGDPIVYLINLEDPAGPSALEQLNEEASVKGYCVRQSTPHFALNYSNGDPVHFVAVRYDAEPCPDGGLSAERVRLEIVE